MAARVAAICPCSDLRTAIAIETAGSCTSGRFQGNDFAKVLTARLVAERRPCVHQPPALDRTGRRADRPPRPCRSIGAPAPSRDFARKSVRSAAQSRKVERKPCGPHRPSIRRNTALRAISRQRLTTGAEKHDVQHLRIVGNAARSSMACGDRARDVRGLPSCARRDGPKPRPGRSRPRVAPRTSPDRAAVRMANSSARAPIPVTSSHRRHECRDSIRRTAAWCSTFATLDGFGRSFEVAAPARRVLALAVAAHVAQSRTASMRPRTRVAVSVSSSRSAQALQHLRHADVAHEQCPS